jgi:hypothetical protein
MLCPANILGYFLAIRLVLTGVTFSFVRLARSSIQPLAPSL